MMNLSKLNDISEILDRQAELSDSGVEDLPEHLIDHQKVEKTKNAVRLKELGPRISLQLLKVENGFLNGQVLYNRYIKKNEDEIEQLKQKKLHEKRLKERRRKQQEENIKRKQQQQAEEEEENDHQKKQSNEMNDIDWYRKEVGEEPEIGLFDKRNKKFNPSKKKFKRQK